MSEESVAADTVQQEANARGSLSQDELPDANDSERPQEKERATTEVPDEPQEIEAASVGEQGRQEEGTAPESEESQLEAVRAELEQVQAQAAEYLDGWQRARAEFANYKKRVDAERVESRRISNEALLLKLLPVIDDFERACQTIPEDLADGSWVDGIAMILRKLRSVLEGENVTPIEAEGQPFDPKWHEAVMQEETDDHPDGYVTEVMQKGYRLGERVLRPSMVKVARNQNQAVVDE
jgi:molecular chaperone GrpE